MSGLTISRLAAVLLGEPELASGQRPVQELADELVGIAFRYVLPADIRHVPVGTIIKFREEHAAQRASFQKRVAELVATLGEVRDVQDLDSLHLHLQAEYEKSLAPELKLLEDQLKRAGIDTAWGVVNAQTALPPVLGAAMGVAGVANPLLLAGAGLAICVWGVLRKWRRDRADSLAASPTAYLYDMKRDLAPGRLASRVVQRAEALPLK